MQLKKLKETQDSLAWPTDSNDLPIVTWETCPLIFDLQSYSYAHQFTSLVQKQSVRRPLILIAGFIHDVSKFIEDHPGGAHLIKKYIGK